MRKNFSIAITIIALGTIIFGPQPAHAICGQTIATQPSDPPACVYIIDNGSGGGTYEYSAWPDCPGLGAGTCCSQVSECPSNGGGPIDEDLPITGGQPGQIKNPIITKIFGQMNDSDGGVLIIQLLLRNSITLGLGIAGLIFVFIFIRGGYIFLTSGPDKEAHQKATKMLTNGVIGLALILSLFAIIYVLNTIFGINIYNLHIGSIG